MYQFICKIQQQKLEGGGGGGGREGCDISCMEWCITLLWKRQQFAPLAAPQTHACTHTILWSRTLKRNTNAYARTAYEKGYTAAVRNNWNSLAMKAFCQLKDEKISDKPVHTLITLLTSVDLSPA